ncbi:recombinase family protein [Streptomyces europaeiscabiei]|uniref:recombinase family protein n=1 Tax=Streptomyces TaxID=1883 RepID=UPI000A372732|nr:MULTISPECIES: recombinase family protein [Streptomyces]MDX3583525.1 recombinase family protein [Streptomyces europaeiscabiei]MDX3629178.1 recombinase family protein [Streptomyces europaeiscabiei]MDX3647204.1 recombinase family protein [Streptomyces europaeiscabiei]WUD36015.1 recombinase family protein [Streptomyces europaeiscabiei]
MGETQRALLAARISIDTDESTSITRQLEKLHTWAEGLGHAVAGVVEDRSVSGAVDLPERPSMGPWLTEEGREKWDVLAVATQDRLSRDDLHFMAFVKNVLDWGKTLVVLDDPSFDISTETGRLIAYAKATQAAGELRKIRQRVADARDYLRRNGLFAGGLTPFGYVYGDSEDGKHYVLVPEAEYAKLLQEISERVRSGVSTNQIARELNAKGVLTWRDYLRELRGKDPRRRNGKALTEPKGTNWSPQVVQRILKHPACAGFLAYKGEPYEDDQGNLVMATEYPILTNSEWQATVTAIKSRGVSDIRRTNQASLLTGVARCGTCGARMFCHRLKKTLATGEVKVYRHYSCAARSKGMPCANSARIPEDLLNEVFEEALLSRLGELPEVVKMTEPGEDHTAELEQVRARLLRLEKDYENGRYDDEDKEESYWRMHGNLTRKQKELKAKPVRPAVTRFVPTGLTWAQKWGGMRTEERRDYLTGRGVQVYVWKKAIPNVAHGVVVSLGDLKQLAQAAGLGAASVEGWQVTGWNVPAHWINPELRDFPGLTLEPVPEFLKELKAV